MVQRQSRPRSRPVVHAPVVHAPVVHAPDDDEDGGDEEPPLNPSGRPASRICLPEEVEDRVAEFVHQNPFLYDKSLRDFRDTAKKQRLWMALGDELNKDCKL